MSDEATCCYCGGELGPIMLANGYTAYHDGCHRDARFGVRVRAEYAATLAAAHDASVAAFEATMRGCDEAYERLRHHNLACAETDSQIRKQLTSEMETARRAAHEQRERADEYRSEYDTMCEHYRDAVARAEAAEAQLAAARADGARAVLAWLAGLHRERWEDDTGCPNDEVWVTSEETGGFWASLPEEIDAVIAAWQAAQTEAAP